MAGTELINEVPGFEHLPGNHCGSTALRNLLRFHGVPITEELAFGLGAGAGFYYIPLDGQSPSRFMNGRTGRLEDSFLQLTGAPLRMRTFETPELAWKAAAACVDEGRPALLLTDLFHLDHYGNSAHFPGHAVLLVGYDEEAVYVSDTAFEELQRTSRAGLDKARFEQHPFFQLHGNMFDLPAGESVTLEQLRAAAPAAIEAAAKLMHEPQFGEFEGLPALRRFAAEAGSWPETISDWQWVARFSYQVIEKRGTGGGNFRAMYSRFLEEVGRPEDAALAGRASELWSTLAADLFSASESDTPDAALWAEIDGGAQRVLAAEEALWDALGAPGPKS